MSGSVVTIWLALVPGTAVVFAAATALPGRARRLPLTPLAALPGLLAALVLPLGSRATFSWVLLGLDLHLDSIARPMLALSSILWMAGGTYALGYLKDARRSPSFHAFFLLAMAGNLGLTIATDAAGFYFFFALLSFSAFGLVVFNQTNESWRAGRVTITLTIIGEVALFTGLILMVHQTGDLALAAVASAPPSGLALFLLVVAFGIKAGMVPVHVWLPLAHPVAPVPASAVLSGAMIKAGLLGWLRILPLGAGDLPGVGMVFIGLGLSGAFAGVAIGLLQTSPKTILAYSSISQMGLMTAGVGLAVALPDVDEAVLGAVLLYALHHALTKGALFLGVGVAERARDRWVPLSLALPALVLAGLPLTSGAAAKTALKMPLSEASGWWINHLTWVFGLAAVGTTVLMTRFLLFVRRISRGPGSPPLTMTVPWAALSLATLVVPWVWCPVLARQSLAPAKVWAVSWPLLIGVLLAIAAVRGARRWRPPTCPEGDLLVPLETLGAAFRHRLVDTRLLWRALGGATRNRIVLIANAWWWRLRRQTASGEQFLLRWESTATLFLGLVVLVFALLAAGQH